jgi:hypothetical protein
MRNGDKGQPVGFLKTSPILDSQFDPEINSTLKTSKFFYVILANLMVSINYQEFVNELIL